MDISRLIEMLKQDDINSTGFRAELKGLDDTVEINKDQYKKIIKSSKDFSKTSTAYEEAAANFSETLSEIARQELAKDETSAIGLALLKFGIVSSEINHLHKEMFRAMSNFLTFPLENAAKEDNRSSSRKAYDKTRQTYETTFTKFNKCQEEEEKKWILKDLETNKLKLNLETCDLLEKYQEFEVKRQVEFLNNMNEFYNAQVNFYQQSSDVLGGLEIYMKNLVTSTVEKRNKFQEEKKTIGELKEKFSLELGKTEYDDGLPRVRVTRDYKAVKESELSITRNDIIIILEKTQKEWWKGDLNGTIGYFPSEYVMELTIKTPTMTQKNYNIIFGIIRIFE